LAIELASTDPAVAAAIAHRSGLETVIKCQLLSETKAGRVKLEQSVVDDLSRELKDASKDCSTAAPAVRGAR
jgi:hypothetical protein